MLLANHGALTVGSDLYSAYFKMETIEHFAQISLVARLLGGENLLAREEVVRLQGLRGTYGIKAPAPICAEPDATSASLSVPAEQDATTCQVVDAPPGRGLRVVPESAVKARSPERAGTDTEIRLTYRELSALIEDAIRSLR
jgi:L-fuculose-phosphate aldolase